MLVVAALVMIVALMAWNRVSISLLRKRLAVVEKALTRRSIIAECGEELCITSAPGCVFAQVDLAHQEITAAMKATSRSIIGEKEVESAEAPRPLSLSDREVSAAIVRVLRAGDPDVIQHLRRAMR